MSKLCASGKYAVEQAMAIRKQTIKKKGISDLSGNLLGAFTEGKYN